MKIVRLLLAALCLTGASALASSRTSASYSLTMETVDTGGGHATGGLYVEDGSSNLSGGVSSVASPTELARISYAGQLYEVTSLTANIASPTMVTVWQILDDGSLIVLPATASDFIATGLALNNITLGFAPTPGQVFTLLHSTSPIVGTFAYLPQGSTVTASYNGLIHYFALSYTGGTGSDIILTSSEIVPAMPVWAMIFSGALLLGLAMQRIKQRLPTPR